MSSFFQELKERRVVRVAIGYAIAAWLIVQIASTVLPTFHVPEWVLQALIVVVALGFPAALVLAWAFDVTPSGIQKTADGVGGTSPRNRRYGWILASVGLFIEAARPALERESLASPLDASRHAQLGLLYAYLGRKEDALREGRRAVDLAPESKDTLDGPSMTGYLALICARTGETEQALTVIERLLRIPGVVTTYIEANMTLQELRLRWQWDPLRNNPRFQKILASSEPKTVYR